MSDNSKPLENAVAIIEAFGGIRPMSSKTGVPVTTIQGWKKRNVIPGNRRDEILASAQDNNVDLTVILEKEANPVADMERPSFESHVVQASKKAEKPESAEPLNLEESQEIKKPRRADVSFDDDGDNQSVIEQLVAMERKAVQKSTWITTSIIMVVLAIAAFILWPTAKKVENNTLKLAGVEQNVENLEDQVLDVNRRASFIRNIVPEDMQERLTSIQNQARNLQQNIDQLSQKASDIGDAAFSQDAGPISQRLTKIEEQLSQYTGPVGLSDLSARIETLEQSVQGQTQLSTAFAELQGMVGGINGRMDSLEQNLSGIQGADTALGQTLEGVSGDDLKAAAMLIAFSQMRDSFNREAPFEDDLVLLRRMAGEDNTELQMALDRLAPYAQRGVLTPSGLTEEFKTLTGDIVVSSLKGEDVSITDKAKARLNDIFSVEKDGELITGTDTQATVTRAEYLLEQGDIEGAIAQLQTLEGEPAEKAQGFMEQAQMTLLSQDVQTLVRDTILSQISNGFPTAAGSAGALYNAPLDTMGSMKDTMIESVEGTLSGPQVVKDPESGMTILPSQNGFKGFSTGQQQ